MKYLFLLLSFIIVNSYGQNRAQELKQIHLLAQNHHISPPKLNDSLSKDFFNKFIQDLDPYCFYFTENDINNLKEYQYQLDNEIISQSWTFIPKVTELFNKRLLENKQFYNNINLENILFNKNDSITFNYKQIIRPKDKNELNLRLTQYLKYKTLYHLFSKYYNDSINNNELLSKLKSAKNDALQIIQRKINRIEITVGGIEAYITNIYFNSYLAQYDPHSNYFNKTEYNYFEKQLSKEGLSFGLVFENDLSGGIKVKQIIPGSTAWKSGKIFIGDFLEKIEWERKSIDIIGMHAYEVSHLLETSPLQATFTFSRQGEMQEPIPLSKTTIDNTENIVSKTILSGDKKIGYILLPTFYSDDSQQNDIYAIKGAADDIAKAVYELKKENIEGLIIDFRYNGGGSLQEGLNIAGMFIDYGPLIIYQSKDDNITIKDFNRGAIYDGPLAIMTNNFSASASEIFAASLQDYHRAVIVGTKSYGKSTAQRTLLLDSTNNKGWGAIKVTTNFIFRLDGTTTQFKGVIPDFYLPEKAEKYNYREEIEYKPLIFERNNKKTYYTPLPMLYNDSTLTNANKRIKSSPYFSQQNKLSKIKEPIDFPLDFNTFKTLFTNELYPTLLNPEKNSSFETKLLLSDEKINQANEFYQITSKETVEKIQNDPYIRETYLILNDIINQ